MEEKGKLFMFSIWIEKQITKNQERVTCILCVHNAIFVKCIFQKTFSLEDSDLSQGNISFIIKPLDNKVIQKY